jgi:hypothetical protein
MYSPTTMTMMMIQFCLFSQIYMSSPSPEKRIPSISSNLKHGNNIQPPKCIDCRHFIPYKFSGMGFSHSLSYCKKNSKVNSFSDMILYEYADVCRKDEKKCGYNGKMFDGYSPFYTLIIQK